MTESFPLHVTRDSGAAIRDMLAERGASSTSSVAGRTSGQNSVVVETIEDIPSGNYDQFKVKLMKLVAGEWTDTGQIVPVRKISTDEIPAGTRMTARHVSNLGLCVELIKQNQAPPEQPQGVKNCDDCLNCIDIDDSNSADGCVVTGLSPETWYLWDDLSNCCINNLQDNNVALVYVSGCRWQSADLYCKELFIEETMPPDYEIAPAPVVIPAPVETDQVIAVRWIMEITATKVTLTKRFFKTVLAVETTLAEYKWFTPREYWATRCENKLTLDRTGIFPSKTPMGLNEFNLCQPPCTICLSPFPDDLVPTCSFRKMWEILQNVSPLPATPEVITLPRALRMDILTDGLTSNITSSLPFACMTVGGTINNVGTRAQTKSTTLRYVGNGQYKSSWEKWGTHQRIMVFNCLDSTGNTVSVTYTLTAEIEWQGSFGWNTKNCYLEFPGINHRVVPNSESFSSSHPDVEFNAACRDQFQRLFLPQLWQPICKALGSASAYIGASSAFGGGWLTHAPPYSIQESAFLHWTFDPINFTNAAYSCGTSCLLESVDYSGGTPSAPLITPTRPWGWKVRVTNPFGTDGSAFVPIGGGAS